MSVRFVTALVVLLAAPWTAQAVSIDTVPVGYLNNAPGPEDGNDMAYGSVSQNYRIGTYEVTNEQYAEFLNAKAASDPLGLYNTEMGTAVRGGIARTGSDGSYVYTVKADMGNKPVNLVSWYDTIRFVNWLHNGQANGDTESGAYTLEGFSPTPSNSATITRNVGATWFLPDANEWYKAAYYDARDAAMGGPPGNDHYWLYPVLLTDDFPVFAEADAIGNISNPGPHVVNYASRADWNGVNGNVTTVGSAGPLSASFFKTFDQGGNVAEWIEESLDGGLNRSILGGGFSHPEQALRADVHPDSVFLAGGPSGHDVNVGFRVATVPEPGTLTLVGIGCFALIAGRWMRHHRVRPSALGGWFVR